MASIIVGQSFGGSSFQSAFSDFTVQVRGSVMAVTSPRVFEVAIGEQISFEELGGVDVHARKTGQIDLGVESFDEAYAAVRRWLSYLPSSVHQSAPRAEPMPSERWQPDERLAQYVPMPRRRGYDMRKFCARLLDEGSFFELQPLFARNLTVGLGHLDGWSVGVIANNPMFQAGVLDPDACDKAIRMMCLCDAFNLSMIWLMDVPGFMVGRKVEHERMLFKAIRMVEALGNLSTPTLSVVIRKGFGLAFQAMNTAAMGATAFQKGLGAIHAISHPVGAVHNTHHGTTNAVCMPEVLKFNRPAIEDRFDIVASYLGIKGGFDGFCAFVDEFNESLGIPQTLGGIGINDADLDALTKSALNDPSVGGNPMPMTYDNTRAMIEALL